MFAWNTCTINIILYSFVDYTCKKNPCFVILCNLMIKLIKTIKKIFLFLYNRNY